MTKAERIAHWNNNFYKWNNFNENDMTYIVLGNTYEIKDELKKKGAKFSRELGWHFKNPVDGYPIYEVKLDEVAHRSEDGKIIMDYERAEKFVKELHRRLDPVEVSNSEYIGNIGDKFVGFLKLERIYRFNGNFGYTGVYSFKDYNDNIVVWITDAYRDLEEDCEYEIYGKIKDHREFNGNKQTIISRCKFSKVEEV